MPPHFRWTDLGSPLGHRYAPPRSEWWSHARDADASSPDATAEQVLGQWEAAAALLLPPVYPLRGDHRMEAAIAHAVNEWTAAEWLENVPGFFGSIAVFPGDPKGAVREIQHWAEHPAFVQVTVPLHVHAPYGEAPYVEIWAAAAEHGLPVAIRSGGGGGVEFPASAAGELATFLEYHATLPLAGVVHLTSLISEGVFERVPGLTVIFTDGGIGTHTPLMWRSDAKARALKDEMPWLHCRPSKHLRNRVRFLVRDSDIPSTEFERTTLVDIAHARQSWLYGSNFPMWDTVPPDWWGHDFDDVAAENALETYPRMRESLRLPPISPTTLKGDE